MRLNRVSAAHIVACNWQLRQGLPLLSKLAAVLYPIQYAASHPAGVMVKSYDRKEYYLAVGDQVTMRYYWQGDEDLSLVRTITEIMPSLHCSTGALASATATSPCPTCGLRRSKAIFGVDAGYFVPVEKK